MDDHQLDLYQAAIDLLSWDLFGKLLPVNVEEILPSLTDNQKWELMGYFHERVDSGENLPHWIKLD